MWYVTTQKSGGSALGLQQVLGHVQLALMGKPGQCKVAATQVAGDGVDGIGAEQQVELRVERVAQEQLDHHLTCP